jgi:mersacidin/lichenicidin family type 2 lantibiotic
MCKTDVVRAWKDEEYRMSLSAAEREMLPENPALLRELPFAVPADLQRRLVQLPHERSLPLPVDPAVHRVIESRSSVLS